MKSKSPIIIGLVLLAAALSTWAANELSVKLYLVYGRGSDAYTRTVITTLNVTNAPRYGAVINVTNGGNTVISMPNVVTAGVCFVSDNSPSNINGYVRISSDGTNWLPRVKPGEPAFFRLDSTNLIFTVGGSNITHQVELSILSD